MIGAPSNQFYNRYPKRTIKHTENTKKTLLSQTTRNFTANRRKYRTIEVATSPKKKQKKKINSNTLFNTISKTTDITTSINLRNLTRPTSQRSRRSSFNNNSKDQTVRRSLQYSRRSPLNKLLRRNPKQFEQNIHNAVYSKSLSIAKELTLRTSIDYGNNQNSNNAPVDKKKQKLLFQLNQQANSMVQQMEKAKINFTKYQNFSPASELNRYGRLGYKNKGNREQFRIDLSMQEDITHQRPIPKAERYSIKTQSKQKDNFIIKQAPSVCKQSQKFFIQQPMKKINVEEEYLEHIVIEAPRVSTFQNEQAKIKIPTEKQNKPMLDSKHSISYILSPNTQFQDTNQSIQQIKLEVKQPDLVYQMTESEGAINTQKEIGVSNQQSKKTQMSSEEVLALLKKRNQDIRIVGEIVGHGLKMLKGININWILPCVPIYKKFYQLRVQIQQQAQKFQVQNQFISKNRHENERVQQSYINMMKAAQKKPMTSSQLAAIRNSNISDRVDLSNIIVQLQKYMRVVEKYSTKADNLNLIKMHFAMIINSVFALAYYQKISCQLQRIDPENQQIDQQISTGMKLLRKLQ